MVDSPLQAGFRAVAIAVPVNLTLAIVKILGGVVGHSYALIADGIESTTDIVSSLVVWGGLKIASLPPDESHPYGHGKAESIAAAIAALGLLVAAVTLAVQSVREILIPHQTPHWFTVPVVVLAIGVKEILARFVLKTSRSLESTSLEVDAWHHRSDAITSVAVLIGISVALIGGPGYESADDWASLLACGIIAFNGASLLRLAIGEIMDAAVGQDIQAEIRLIAGAVPGVLGIEKIRVRKSGVNLFMDIHVEVDGNISVTKGHTIGHDVKDLLIASSLNIQDVVVHVEPKRDTAADSHG